MEAEAAKGHSGMGFDRPLDPMVVILGILGAVLIFGRATIPKEYLLLNLKKNFLFCVIQCLRYTMRGGGKIWR